MWFVARHEIEYVAEAFSGDEIMIATWIASVTKTTATRVTKVWRRRAEGGAPWELAVDAVSRWVHMNLATRRPIRIPFADLAVYGWSDSTASIRHGAGHQ